MFRAVVFVLFLVSLLNVVRADFYTLENSTIDIQMPVVRRVVAMYAADDAPSLFQLGAGTGDSYITFDITFETPTHNNIQGSAEVVILQATDLNDVGFSQHGQVISYCCIQAIKDEGACTEEGKLIVSGKAAAEKRYRSFPVEFNNQNSARIVASYQPSKLVTAGDKGGKVEAEASPGATDVTNAAGNAVAVTPVTHYSVQGTSEHILIVSFCKSSNDVSKLNYHGTSTWVNSFGYLPGRLYGFLPFYGFVTIVYILLAVAWFSWYCLYYTEVFPVQNAISGVLVICLIESSFWFMDYLSFNYTGRRVLFLVLCAVLLTVFRLTLSRMLVVAVSLGYGVARPSLGANKLRIIMLGVIYFGFEASLELVTRYAQTNEVAEHWRVILSLPVAVLNAIFYWWIFVALQRTHSELSTGGQAHKLAIYRQFTIVLVVSLVAAVCFAFYQIYFMTTHQFALHWANLWLLDGGFSVILYTVVLITILFLWKPSKDSRRYAYSELPINQNDDDEDDQFDSTLNDVEMQGTKGPETAEQLDEDDDNAAPSNQPDSAAQMFSIDDDKH